MSEIRLASVVETPDGTGDVVAEDGDLVEVTLNDAVAPTNAVKQSAEHAGWYRRDDCELVQ